MITEKIIKCKVVLKLRWNFKNVEHGINTFDMKEIKCTDEQAGREVNLLKVSILL